MQTNTVDGLIRLTDTAVIMEFGPAAMPVKGEASPRVVLYENILEIDYQAPKTFSHGYLRLIVREGQTKVDPMLDTYASRLAEKKPAAALYEALQQKVGAVEYVAPAPSNEPEQVDRKVTAAEISHAFKNVLPASATFQEYSLVGRELQKQAGRGLLPPKTWPVAECEATVDTGAAISARVTATRVAAGAMLFGKTGAVVGAIAKKDRTKVYLQITTPDEVILKEVRGLDEGKARQFANKLNNLAATHRARPVGQDADTLVQAATAVAPPPPPPSNVPAGWYPQGDVQRYWDGNAWTDHTAPLAPQTPQQ
ncbi:DUF2510 domain-containing protein [Pseudarthrobacter sp. LT1]|uniref:DUF2510 domain-containing protein n=1 Tax=Pseudarthrobacter sp. LT1 TaxID=3111450 RepID=UPI002D789416|nr:DUF2510 domain-containing protein [Pseudarthrobacter sp. LT1]WRT12511.1 DUF2510 domain-containing protein [Pseudarthrobacter sp. LT1]